MSSMNCSYYIRYYFDSKNTCRHKNFPNLFFHKLLEFKNCKMYIEKLSQCLELMEKGAIQEGKQIYKYAISWLRLLYVSVWILVYVHEIHTRVHMQGTLQTFEISNRMRKSKREWNLSAQLFQQYQLKHKSNVMMENSFSNKSFLSLSTSLNNRRVLVTQTKNVYIRL